MQRNRIARTELTTTALGLGGTGLGNMYTAVDERDAVATVAAAYQAGVRYFDTAPAYGNGLSEVRLGRALAGYPRHELVVSTKVGYALHPLAEGEAPIALFENPLPFGTTYDFSRDAVRRSLDDSMRRLQTDRIDIVWIHDPDESISIDPSRDPYERSHFREAMDQAYPVLDELRRQGAIGAIGVGMNQWQMLEDFAKAGSFDCFLLAGRYTLLDQPALASFLPRCERAGISVIIGGPYSSGILASGAVPGATYNYAPASPEIVARVRRLEAVCARHDVALPAAALQFPLAHPAVASVIPGARSAAELAVNVAHLGRTIPASFWAELKALQLIAAAAPVPTA